MRTNFSYLKKKKKNYAYNDNPRGRRKKSCFLVLPHATSTRTYIRSYARVGGWQIVCDVYTEIHFFYKLSQK